MARSRKRRSSSRRGGRRLRLALVAVAVAAGGWYFGGDYLPGTGAGGGGAADTAGVDIERAREQLAGLTVAEWAGTGGYSRERFPHWRTVDGCDVRQTVLARDGEQIQTESADDCRVVSGSWSSAYDQVSLSDPGDLDIDHTVPLANAWRTGAAEWDDERRAEFANDLDSPQLIAVSASSNRAKGDQDPSQWRPDNRAYWCRYAHDWVVVKDTWQLWITADERDALADMLDTCD